MKVISSAFLALLIVTPCQTEASSDIAVRPGDNVAEIVARAPVGTTFRLIRGFTGCNTRDLRMARNSSAKAKSSFNGATLLSDWHRVDGFWVAQGPKARSNPGGKCQRHAPLCGHGEDLFVDGKIYRRVASIADVTLGTYYDDGLSIHISEDPTDKVTEFSTAPFAITGEASDVLLQDIVFEKYASRAQHGAVDFPRGRNWVLRNVTARWNHGLGARVGPGTHISGGSYSNNGQLGLAGSGSHILIEGAEIAFNNYAGFNSGWEAGGTKFVRTDNLVVRKNCVHNNDGPGLWTDVDNINIEFVDNLVFDNRGDGIKHEISYRAKIYGNTVARNGHERLNWLWGSQILIQNSQDVEAYNNIVEVRADFGNGIAVINQKRGEGRYGPRMAKNNFIHNNTIIHLGASGLNGMVADYGREWFDEKSGNVFDQNTYVVPHDRRGYFEIKNNRAKFSNLPNLAMEQKGIVADRDPQTNEP